MLLAHHVAVARALNTPTIAADTSRWLAEMARHAAAFDESLRVAVSLDPGAGLDLALELARYWDWTGDTDRLRNVLSALLDALPETETGRRADAHGWLAYASLEDAPGPASDHLQRALAASTQGDELGRTRAVGEGVVERARDPVRALAAAEAAVQLLRRYGSAEEAAYVHASLQRSPRCPWMSAAAPTGMWRTPPRSTPTSSTPAAWPGST